MDFSNTGYIRSALFCVERNQCISDNTACKILCMILRASEDVARQEGSVG